MKKTGTILIIDSKEVNRILLQEIFEQDYHILSAKNREEALLLMQEHFNTIILVLLNMTTPVKISLGLLSFFKADPNSKHIPVIVFTAPQQLDDEIRALDMGAADLIMKPIEPQIVKRRVQNILAAHRYTKNLEHKLTEQKQRIASLNHSFSSTLRTMMRHRNMESAHHLLLICEWTKILLTALSARAKQYNLSKEEIDLISVASLLHDIGKISLQDSLLQKTLIQTDEELTKFSLHCMEGCKILEIFDQEEYTQLLNYAYNICRFHHEYFNGSGYPDGASRKEIPFYVQAVSLADYYGDLITEKNLSHEEAVNQIKESADVLFFTELIDSFLHVHTQLKQVSESIHLLSSAASQKRVSKLMEQMFDKQMDKPLSPCPASYDALLKYLNATVFELDLKTMEYQRMRTGDSDFAKLKSVGNYTKDFIPYFLQIVRQEFQETLYHCLTHIIHSAFFSKPEEKGEPFQLYNQAANDYQWYRVSILNLSNDTNRKTKRLLIFQNVTEEIRLQSERMKFTFSSEKAFFPSNLLNMATFQEVMETTISSFPSAVHALLLLNLDDYKLMNDQLGQLEGDRILRSIGTMIKGLFRSNDLVARTGSDEFVIFITDIISTKYLLAKVEHLMHTVRLLGDEIKSYHALTASVGIALYPEAGKNFKTLLRHADTALSLAKSFGKNQWRIYVKQAGNEIRTLRNHSDRLLEALNRDEEVPQLMELAIYESENEEHFIDSMLTIAAKKFHLDLAFLLEAGEGNFLLRFMATPESMSAYYKNAYDHNRFCKHFEEEPNHTALFFDQPSSLLVMPIYLERTLLGFTAFFDANPDRLWTQEEIRICHNLCKSAVSLLYQKKLCSQLHRATEINRILFDSPKPIYIVDESYQILQINQAMKKLFGSKKEGICYQTLFEQKTPCADCPLKQLTKSKNQIVIRKNYGQTEDYELTASRLQWNQNQPAYLLLLST